MARKKLTSFIYPAVSKPNTWFIYRENGLEIEVHYTKADGVFRNSKGMSIATTNLFRPQEKEYFKTITI